jgi:8-oxo-dGTP diphosphatase
MTPLNEHWPRCGASGAIFRGREVLLVERGQGALKGLWSLPGGHIEPGETARSAALREIREESDVIVDLRGLVDIHEVVLRGNEAEIKAHYLIAVFVGRWLKGDPRPGGDASAARFVSIDAIGSYPLTDGAAALIRRAWAKLEAQEC